MTKQVREWANKKDRNLFRRKLSPHSLDCQVRLVECKVCGWDEDKGPVGCGTFSGANAKQGILSCVLTAAKFRRMRERKQRERERERIGKKSENRMSLTIAKTWSHPILADQIEPPRGLLPIRLAAAEDSDHPSDGFPFPLRRCCKSAC
ncbi:hypothetical protein RUM43_002478 [Polyplax serrata]|uniref:Uncharacterized protein n=1 Tax=Polyplax serrata TaxID=468196 RepID=A0AAN8PCT0_POLSC